MWKSSSSSSTRRTVSWSGAASMAVETEGQVDDLEPIAAEGLHDVDQAPEGDRLGDERVHAQVVGAEHVLFRARGREHHDRYLTEILVRLDLRQSLAAVLLRHVEVEQDDAGG